MGLPFLAFALGHLPRGCLGFTLDCLRAVAFVFGGLPLGRFRRHDRGLQRKNPPDDTVALTLRLTLVAALNVGTRWRGDFLPVAFGGFWLFKLFLTAWALGFCRNSLPGACARNAKGAQ